MATSVHPVVLQEPVESRLVWEAPVRIAHWMMAISIVGLLLTGFYIAWPIAFTQGEAFDSFLMGRFRQIHFAFGYVFLFGFLLRFYWFFRGNNYARSGFPFFWRKEWWHQIFEQAWEYATLRFDSRYVGHNKLGGLSYILGVAFLGAAEILTGFAMYGESNPGGFWDRMVGWITPMVGGSYGLHHWHHLFAWGLLLFAAVHIYIVIVDSIFMDNGLLNSIFTGRKYVRKGDIDSDHWIN